MRMLIRVCWAVLMFAELAHNGGNWGILVGLTACGYLLGWSAAGGSLLP
jgi:hypothetical protein